MNEPAHAGGACLEYMAARSRGTGSAAWRKGVLSCWATSDARIVAEDGVHLPFVRPHNGLGVTDASNVLFADGVTAGMLETLQATKYMVHARGRRGGTPPKVITASKTPGCR